MATNLPLGTDADGREISWQMTRPDGLPRHGLVVGPKASGGTVSLVRLARGAMFWGIRTVLVDLGMGYYAWADTTPHLALRTKDEVTRELNGPRLGDQQVPTLLLVDGADALQACPEQWENLLEHADRLMISVVVRTYRVDAHTLGSMAIQQVLARGQYLHLGRQDDLNAELLDLPLPQTPPQGPGRGIYSDGQTLTPVAIPYSG